MPEIRLALPSHPKVNYHSWQLTETWDVNDTDPHRTGVLRQEIAKSKLIERSFGSPREVKAYPSRKPMPIDDVHISFSHSADLIVLASSEQNVGIDLQKFTDKLVRVSGKFVSEEESTLLSADPLERASQIHYMWCAKEAVFKLYGTEVPFKDIVSNALPFSGSGVIEATVKGQHTHRVYYGFFDEFCFCLAL